MVLTRRLVDAGRLLGVDVLDVVIGEGRYVSFRERGWL
jgi:DNA repair protein RadC